VLTEDGREVGRVLRVEPGPSQDLWVVGDGAREHLVPACPKIVCDVDLKARRVVIRPPEVFSSSRRRPICGSTFVTLFPGDGGTGAGDVDARPRPARGLVDIHV